MTAPVGSLGQQVLLCPGMENIAVDVAVKQGNREETGPNHCADNISSAFGSPVLRAITPCTASEITMSARHIMGKATFIKIHNWQIICLMLFNPLLEVAPSVGVRPQVL